MKKIVLVLIVLLLPIFLFSAELSGEGYGKTLNEAKANALTDLT